MSISISMARTLEELDPKVRQAFYEVFEKTDWQMDETVTKKKFNELKGIVVELAKTQKRREKRLNGLE